MKIIKILIINILLFYNQPAFSDEENFNDWLIKFKKEAMSNNISELTFNKVMKDARYLPKVIEYDRYQPEFYEDTLTYISKRTSKNKVKKGIRIYNDNKKLINNIDDNFNVEKELLLSLMGIETNFGTYLGKMDIISSLATLSYDKRRKAFFTSELITLLKLVEKNIIDHNILYGSWAGAYGNFQFMPSTIENYAIDFNLDNKIELKSYEDSFASAANYINKLGWKKKGLCYKEITLLENVPKKYLNTSARKLHHKKKIKSFKKYIKNFNDLDIDSNELVAIITPDKDIIPDAETLKPAYIVFSNYELVLKWNRSLRFALAVCNLKDKIKNEL